MSSQLKQVVYGAEENTSVLERHEGQEKHHGQKTWVGGKKEKQNKIEQKWSLRR